MTDEQLLDVLAEQVYDFCNANRGDNLTKEGNPGDPRKVSCPYAESMESVKHFYRNVVRWHLKTT